MGNSEADNESFVEEEKILQALTALRQLNENFSESAKKKPLIEDLSESSIFLQVTLKRIPQKRYQKFIKVRLPNSYLTNNAEVCLITGDLDKNNTKAEIDPDVLHYKELLRKENISSISEVMTMRQLRTEYKPYEARRKLVGAYDIFLCDKKIAGALPSTLGKNFFKKRKLPLQINMNVPFLKKQIDNALSTTRFQISCRGNSVNSEVANFAMSDDKIVENVIAAVKALKEGLPGEWNNVLGLYIKAARSKAIPIYMSFGDASEVVFKPFKRERPAAGELSTQPEATVKVTKDGRISVKRRRLDEEGNVKEDTKKIKVEKSKKSLKKSKKLKHEKRNSVKRIKPEKEGLVQKDTEIIKKKKSLKSIKKVIKMRQKFKLKSNKKTIS